MKYNRVSKRPWPKQFHWSYGDEVQTTMKLESIGNVKYLLQDTCLSPGREMSVAGVGMQ